MIDDVGPTQAGSVLRKAAENAIAHVSGKAWLVGTWRGHDVRIIRSGSVVVAVAGHVSLNDDELRRAAGRSIVSGSPESLTRLRGVFAIYALTSDGLFVFSDRAGLYAPYYARVQGATVVADRADILANLVGASVDDEWLCGFVVTPEMAEVFARRSPYSGVRRLPPGHLLSVNFRGRVSVSRWWRPPNPDLGLSEGSRLLRHRLIEAVSTPLSEAKIICCDLSGGLDSVSLAFLTGRLHEDRQAYLTTYQSVQPAHEDMGWARRAAVHFAGSTHVEIGPAECPAIFDPIDTPPQLDEPDGLLAVAARLGHQRSLLSTLGSDMHLTGHGGDEVISAPLSYLAARARRHPLEALRRLRGHQALLGKDLLPKTATLTRPPDYEQWLGAVARYLGDPSISRVPWPLWGPVPSPGVWVRKDARACARDVVRAAADGAPPIAATPAQHAAVAGIHAMARARRLARQALDPLRTTAPFLAGQVIDACLSTRLHERSSPQQAKPLLAAAMRDIVPEALLSRHTKGHYNADTYAGLRANLSYLRSLFDKSELAQRGLIDDRQLRDLLRLPFPPAMPVAALTHTVACELWLRSRTPAATPPTHTVTR